MIAIEKDLITTMRKDLDIPAIEVSTYCSDLYISYTKERYDWLKKNYEWFGSCVLFNSAIDGALTIDVPFANINYYN